MTRQDTRAWVAGFCVAVVLALRVPGAGAQEPKVRQGLVGMDDASLFYETVGEGPSIVTIHGGPGLDHTYLRPGMDLLATSHRVVYFDQRGTGRSQAALDSTTINFDVLVDDVDRIRQILGEERIVVLGHSFGGLIAMAYALRYPERTRALILVSTVEPGRRWQGQTRRRQAAARTPEDSVALAQLTSSEAFKAGDPATVSEVYRVAFRGTFRDRTRADELVLDLSRATARNGSEVARLVGTSLGQVDWWDDLGSIRVPTLVVHGTADPTPPAMARELADSIPGAQLVLLNTGHFPYIEDGQGFVGAVSRFLAALPAR